jgi:hypothetical protein
MRYHRLAQTRWLVALLVALSLAANARAHEEFFGATMTNAAEPVTPPVNPTTSTGAPRPASFGHALFVINDLQTQMTMTATVFNIDVTGAQTPDANDNLVNAHIHASPSFSPTTNSPVVWGFFGSPDNDIAPKDLVVTPFTTGVGGTFTSKWDMGEGNNTTFLVQLDNILAEHSYINFHTTQFGGGEIRGTLVSVPEPSTIALVGLGAAAVAIALRRRHVQPE